jgi:DNA ligase-associated metallophosphoesterase
MEAIVAGETLIIHPDRAAYWVGGRSLIVADVHLGKAAAFRALHVPVPDGTTRANLSRLSVLVDYFGADRLLILGDLWHDRLGRSDEALENLREWTESISAEIVLIEGNHDRKAGPLPENYRIRTVTEPWVEGAFALRHYPVATQGAYTLSGHIHPSVVLRGRGRQVLQTPCFWFGQEVGVLPAFGEFTGCAAIRPRTDDQVIAIADGRTFAIHDHEVMVAA